MRRIEVLRPIRWISLRRNEVGSVASSRNVETAMRAGSGNLGIYIEDDRQQRAGLFLRDVAYRLHADLEVRAEADARPARSSTRRCSSAVPARANASISPILAAASSPPPSGRWTTWRPSPGPSPKPGTSGCMLHDLDFANAADPSPRFFRARLQSGVVTVPAWDSPEVRG